MASIKKYLPKSLFGRSLMIIILPIVIMQVLVAYIFFNAHWDRVTANLSSSVAADIGLAIELYEQDPGLERAHELDELMRPGINLSIQLVPDDNLPTARRKSFFSLLDKTLRRALQSNLDDPFWFDTTRYPNYIDIRVKVDEGVLRFITTRERVFAPTGYVFIFWLVTASVLLTLVSVLFIRNQARPIKRLADAAEAFGKGQDVGDYRPSGATEVRQAGQSFVKMQQRIRRQIDQRAAFLAGVSHDLRTPLTRLKLHMAMQDDNEETAAAKRDLKDMEKMLEGYLDFARGLPGEAGETILLSEFVSDCLEPYADRKDHIELAILSDGSVKLKPGAMQRVLQNLIDNALRYGEQCRITIDTGRTHANIYVEDDGPGIPKEQRAAALQPFHRLDEARNQNRDGTGLGLPIVRDIIQTHGGRLDLLESEDMGGLKVVVSLPL